MKNFIILSLCLFSVDLIAQTKTVDSFRSVLGSVKDDTSRINLLLGISQYYRYSNYDSCLAYAMIARQEAKQRYPLGEIRAYNNAADALRFKGKFVTAIEFEINALQLAEKYNFQEDIGQSLWGLSTAYKGMGDLKKGLSYGRQAIAFASQFPNSLLYVLAAGNLGDLFERSNQLDSAMHYENIAYELSVRRQDENATFMTMVLGKIQQKLGNKRLAIEYLQLSISYAKAVNSKRNLVQAYTNLANIFLTDKKFDSAYKYALEGRLIANEVMDKLWLVNVSNTLAQYFEHQGIIDSALFYYKLSANTKDEILDEEKIRAIENIQFNEQMRQQDLAIAAAKEKETRLKNIQLIGIALFIVLFFAILSIMNRWRIKPRFIEFLTVVALLLVFEFAYLLLHPLIDSVSNHQPAFMLVMLVCVAAILVPAHHRIQKWMKNRIPSNSKPISSVSDGAAKALPEKIDSTSKNA